MDAGHRFFFRGFSVLLLIVSLATTANAADYRTQNFIVMAPSAELAKAVGDSAEAYRRDLATHWLGRELPPWPNPCPIRVIAGNMPAQGVTQYNRSPVRDFQMEVVGTPERILDSVLPHEVTHTILATHFGRPLPRWADEGICTTVEHESERAKHEEKLREFLRTRRGIAMNTLFLLTEYPQDVLPMYAQGYSVCQFLIAQRGPQQFVAFLGDYMQRPSWTDNVRLHYGYSSLAELQEQWLAWVSVGNGPVDRFAKINLQNPSSQNPQLASRGNSLQATPAGFTTPSGNDGWGSRGDVRALGNQQPPAGQAAPFGRNVPQAVGRPSDPPSIYSVAQPQPEQGLAPYGASLPPVPTQRPIPNQQPTPMTAPTASPTVTPAIRPQGGSYWR